MSNFELLSGTIFIAPTEKAKEVIVRWQQENDAAPKEWDQRTLARAVEKTKGLRVKELPAEYCCVYDLSLGLLKSDPVIEHYAASRRFKGKL